MKINESYELQIDQIGTYILVYHYVGVKSGNPSTKDIGYYSNLGQALKGCMEHGLIETDLADVKTVSDKMDAQYADIKKFLKRAKKEGKLQEG